MQKRGDGRAVPKIRRPPRQHDERRLRDILRQVAVPRLPQCRRKDKVRMSCHDRSKRLRRIALCIAADQGQVVHGFRSERRHINIMFDPLTTGDISPATAGVCI